MASPSLRVPDDCHSHHPLSRPTRLSRKAHCHRRILIRAILAFSAVHELGYTRSGVTAWYWHCLEGAPRIYRAWAISRLLPGNTRSMFELLNYIEKRHPQNISVDESEAIMRRTFASDNPFGDGWAT